MTPQPPPTLYSSDFDGKDQLLGGEAKAEVDVSRVEKSGSFQTIYDKLSAGMKRN